MVTAYYALLGLVAEKVDGKPLARGMIATFLAA